MVAAAHVSYPIKGVGMIMLDNPPQNQGSFGFLERIYEALQTIKDNGSKVVTIVSDNSKYFCAGSHIPDLLAMRRGDKPSGDPAAWYRVLNELAFGPLISIAVNNGIALGGGAELNWASDIRLAGESAVYAQVEGRVGDIPLGGGTVHLPRLVGKGKAMEVALTARPFSAREMWHFGAVNHVYRDDKLRQEAIKMATRIAENPAGSLRAAKQSINEQWDLPIRDALKNETRAWRQIEHTDTGVVSFEEAAAVYEQGGDSYEVYKFEAPPKEYPY